MHLSRLLTSARRAWTMALAAAVLLAACGGGPNRPTGASPTTRTTGSPSPTGPAPDSPTSLGPGGSTPSEPDTTAADDTPADATFTARIGPLSRPEDPAEIPPLSTLCSLRAPQASAAHRASMAYPEGWHVDDSCRRFDPAGTSAGGGPVAVRWQVVASNMDRAPRQVVGELSDPIHYLGAKGGHPAQRIEAILADERSGGERPRVVLWAVDLAPGSGKAVLVGRARATGDVSFDTAAVALDRMADTLGITPTVGEHTVVTRRAGRRPWTVTWDGHCFALRSAPGGPARDKACGIDAPEEQLQAVRLGGGDEPVVLAGLAPATVGRVTAPAGSGFFGAVTTSLEGASAFGMRFVEITKEATGVDHRGRTVVTTRIEGREPPPPPS